MRVIHRFEKSIGAPGGVSKDTASAQPPDQLVRCRDFRKAKDRFRPLLDIRRTRKL